MNKREYRHIYERLKSIRWELRKLKQTPISNIQDKIEILRQANGLLNEQKKLLLVRQSYLLENNIDSRLQQTG